MRTFLFATLVATLCSCGQSSMVTASPAMQACLAGARQEARSSASVPADVSETELAKASQDFCGCAQRILTPADFEWLRPVFEIAALDMSSEVKRYRLDAHVSTLAGSGPREAIEARLQTISNLVTSECPPPRVSEPAPAATEAAPAMEAPPAEAPADPAMAPSEYPTDPAATTTP